MAVDTDQAYQETVKAAANMLCQMKQRYYHLAIEFLFIKKWHDDLAILDVGEVMNVSRYHLLEYMVFDTDIYERVEK